MYLPHRRRQLRFKAADLASGECLRVPDLGDLAEKVRARALVRNAPELPRKLTRRGPLVDSVKAMLGSDSTTVGLVGLRGMDGIGKSVAARLVADDDWVRRRFRIRWPTTPNAPGAAAIPPAHEPRANAAQNVPQKGPNFVKVNSDDMLTSDIVGVDVYNGQNKRNHRRKRDLGNARQMSLPRLLRQRRIGGIREPIPHYGFPTATRCRPETWRPLSTRRVDRRASRLLCGDERGRQRRSPGGRPRAQQEFASAVSTTRARHAALSKREDVAEIQLSSRPGPQPFQSRAPSDHPPSLQAETLCHIGRMARPRGLNVA